MNECVPSLNFLQLLLTRGLELVRVSSGFLPRLPDCTARRSEAHLACSTVQDMIQWPRRSAAGAAEPVTPHDKLVQTLGSRATEVVQRDGGEHVATLRPS